MFTKTFKLVFNNIINRGLSFFNRIIKRGSSKKNGVSQIKVSIITRKKILELLDDKSTDSATIDILNEKLSLLDYFKNEYREKLSCKILIPDISSADLTELFLENQRLILKHSKDNKNDDVNKILASGNINELFEVRLELLKLVFFGKQNTMIFEETMFRYVGLTELKDEFDFNLIKRRAINNELFSLYSRLIMCASNNFVVNVDSQIYFIKINQILRDLKDISSKELELLDKRKQLVFKLSNVFIKDKLSKALPINMDDIGLVVYLEIELEKYYLKNKKDFNSLCEELYVICEELYVISKLEITPNNKDELLKRIEKLEAKYLLLNMFNKLSEEMFLKLYEAKFNIITKDINCLEASPIKKDDYGYEFYKIIVSRKISEILEGNNQYFNKLFCNAEQCDGSKKIFKKMFFDIEGVLSSRFKLDILLSFDKINGFDELLNSTMINKDNIKIMKEVYDYNIGIILSDAFKEYEELYNFYFADGNSSESYIKWDDTITLKSILEWYQIKSSNLLIEMYRRSNLFEKYPKLPEGIRELGIIHSPHRRNFVDRYIEHLDYLRYDDDVLYSNVVIPNSIKTLKLHNITGYAHVIAIPYGIKEIDIYDSHVPPIPPTVEKIKIRYSKSYYKKTNSSIIIPFYDFKNSEFLRKKENIIALLRNLSSVDRFWIEFYEEDNIERNMEKIKPYERKTVRKISHYDEKFFYIIHTDYGPTGYGHNKREFTHYKYDIDFDYIPDQIISILSTEPNNDAKKSQSLCRRRVNDNNV